MAWYFEGQEEEDPEEIAINQHQYQTEDGTYVKKEKQKKIEEGRKRRTRRKGKTRRKKGRHRAKN